MATHAQGTFQVTSWDEKIYEELEGGAKLTRARITQDFTGDLEAEGGWDLLMFYREDGTAVFTGLARLTGRLGGRAGSFVLLSEGTYDGGEARTAWTVVSGSATGDLKGLRGDGSSVAPHGPNGSFNLDYELG